jgi:hypothetical protein
MYGFELTHRIGKLRVAGAYRLGAEVASEQKY